MSDATGQLSIQVIFNIVIALGGALGGWILGTLWKEIKDAREDHAKLLEKLPETYARRDDVAAAVERLEGALEKGLTRIFDKLDGKADKHF